MSEYFKKENNTISVMESFRKIQKQIDPLYEFRNSLSVLEVANQGERTNAALSIAEMARKAFEQQNLASANVAALSTSANLAQPQIQEVIALQDSSRKIVGGLSLDNNTKFVAENTIKGMYKNDLYKDTVSSLDRLRESIESWRDSINKVGKALKGSEFADLVRELQTYRIPESTLSEFASIVEHLESLKNFESFKAIYRLNNFPSEKLWMQSYSEVTSLTESSLAEVKKIDARISDEISSVDDFNDLTENTRHDLEGVYFNYYYLIIVSYMYYIFILKEYVIKNIDYSKMNFSFVGSSSSIIFGTYLVGYQPNFNNVLDSIVGGIILMKFANYLEK